MTHRVEIFIGPFGSGKSEVAINRALSLAATGAKVTFIDLDLVDPFFRARQARGALEAARINFVAPGREWDEVDLPLLTPEVFGALQRPGHILVDVGGEIQGAFVLRQIMHLCPADRTLYFVVNPFRPGMQTPAQIGRACRAIAGGTGHPISAFIADPHLAAATTASIIREGWERVHAASVVLAIPIAWTAVAAAMLKDIHLPGNIQPLTLHIVTPWEQGAEARGQTRTGR